jgi:hypothetical protein
MDERILFDRFHEALDVEPRPGAYDRMRFGMTNRPIALKKRPAFQMRSSKMGFRVVAALAAGALVVALVAALIASHRALVGSVPAGRDKNVSAYTAMVQSDYNKMAASTSNHCQTIQDTGCAAAVVPLDAALQRWVDDLSSFQSPTRYAVLGGQLRGHLNEVIKELNAAVAFQKANNQAGFALAMDAAVYERAWVDPTVFAIDGTYPRLAGSYHDAVSLAKQSMDACVKGTPAPADLGCQALSSAQDCTGSDTQTCESDVQSAETQAQTFLIALFQNPAPSALANKDAQLQTDLAQADTALLAITDATLSGDSTKAAAGRSSYTLAITAAESDVSVINA